ncbi:MAG: hypothetical protein VB876_16260 [Pirellulales bacterium]
MRQSSKISFAQMNAANRGDAATVARGITLMEVLIAIFVLAVGLMGVAALLPVGKSQVQKGTVQLRAATLATKAFESLETRGILKPSNWMYSTGVPFDFVNVGEGIRYEMTGDAGLSDNGRVMTIDFTPPARLASSLIFDPGFGLPWICEFTSGALQGERRRVSKYDPENGRLTFDGDLYLNYIENKNQIRQPGEPDAPFPIAPRQGDKFVLIRNGPFVVDPQYIAVRGSGGSFAGMPRVSIARSVGADVNDLDDDNNTHELMYLPMGSSISESIFVSGDDLVVKPAVQNEQLPRQQWVSERFDDVNKDEEFDSGIDDFNSANDDINGNDRHDLFLRRHFEGHFSWAAMFSPPEGGFNSRQYTVSVIVFYKRRLKQQMAFATLDYGTSGTVKYGGGDAILRTVATRVADRMDLLRPGQWILVSKTYSRAVLEEDETDTQCGIKHILKAVPIYRWYRLTSVGDVRLSDPDEAVGGSNPYLCNVTLDGADWLTRQNFLNQDGSQSVMNMLGPTATAYLVDDVAAVFQRTIDVESLPSGEP